MEFAREITIREHGKQFFIDSSKVESATVDALIYLIAILQNDNMNAPIDYFAGRLVWPDGQDLCPDELYEMSKAIG